MYRLMIIVACVFLPFPVLASDNYLDNIINTKVTSSIQQKQIPGMAVAIYYKDHIYFYNFGLANKQSNKPVTKTTIFEIGSITKVFTATLLAEQIQSGKMNLQDPVTKYISELNKKSGVMNQVTLQELATHTSSLPRLPPHLNLSLYSTYSKNDLFNFVSKWKPTNSIGKSFLYSNIGFGLIGYALENATGKSYSQLLQDEIFNPLQMSSTAINKAVDPDQYAQGYTIQNKPAKPWPSNAWPAGGAIRSTSSDMANFLEANLNILVQHATPELLKAMQFAQKPLFQAPNFKQGLGWQILADGIINKNGATSGFGAAIALYPPKKTGIVILTNKAGSNVITLANNILKQLAGI